jgi:hypothetical protein
MNIKKLAMLTSLACAVGIIYTVNSLKSLPDAFDFNLDDEEDDDGKI